MDQLTELRVTVAAAAPIRRNEDGFQLTDPFNLEHELRLVKAALLYADHVSLASPRVSLVSAWTLFVDAIDREDAAGALRIARVLTSENPAFAAARAVLLPGTPTFGRALEMPDERLVLDLLRPSRDLYSHLVATAVGQAPYKELLAGIRAGVVDTIEMGFLLEDEGFNPGAIVGEFIGLFARTLAPSAKSVPLLDDTALAVLSAATRVGVIKDPIPPSGSEIGIASLLIGALQAFPDASMDTVLTTRVELAGELARFRAALASYAVGLGATPADPGFLRAAQDLYRREVAPQLRALEEAAETRRLLPLLRAEVAGSQGGSIVKAAIGMAAAGAMAVPELAQAAVGALVVLGDVGSGVYRRYRELEKEQRLNRLLWLYRAPGHLGRKSGKGPRRHGGHASASEDQ